MNKYVPLEKTNQVTKKRRGITVFHLYHFQFLNTRFANLPYYYLNCKNRLKYDKFGNILGLSDLVDLVDLVNPE